MMYPHLDICVIVDAAELRCPKGLFVYVLFKHLGTIRDKSYNFGCGQIGLPATIRDQSI